MKILDLFNKTHCRNDAVRYPYIIAEAGVNHNGNPDMAFQLVDAAAEAN